MTANERPAVLLITADQLRKDALSCYGGEAVDTPNVDRLAAAGIQFERAYCNSPWCLPSRCAIVTGLYPHNNGAYSNFRDCRLSPDQPNLYNTLRRGGYHVAHVGKCHYAPVPYSITRPDATLPYDDFREYYVSLGLDELVLQDDKQVSVWFMDDYAKELQAAGYLEAYRAEVWRRSNAKVFIFPGPAEWHPDGWVGRKAVELIGNYDGRKPFFAWISFSGPHFPFDAPAEYYGRVREDRIGLGRYLEGEFDDPNRIHHRSFHGPAGIEGTGTTGRPCKDHSDAYWRELRRNYFANVALLDDQIGAILRAAEERFGENLLVIFTADHGEMLGNHRLWGKNNCFYEDVLNVPLIVRYPGAGEPQRTDAKVMLIDLMPTILQVAGVEAPPMDGVDLRTNVERGGYRYILAEGDNFICVSDGVTKLVRVRTKRRDYVELIDLAADPHEHHNLADRPEYAGRRAELAQVLVDVFLDALLP